MGEREGGREWEKGRGEGEGEVEERHTQLRLAHLSSNKILPIRRQTETRDWFSV